MNEFQILLTVMISGLGFIGAILMIIWSELKETNKRIDKLSEKTENLDKRLSIMEVKITHIEQQMFRIETSLSTQGHCLFNQSHKEIKAE